ncbi:hypothetical protein BWR18_03045 [Tateyamaria omphalii]|uniref:SPOR domain-containing protein n=2 Tax=Tateyamaria omphalii TaxID=299262 RepID=A0A1P8N060_9RHOB|nr:hypothetical protein BWR18_03045 [Tateyamaria omphalii]
MSFTRIAALAVCVASLSVGMGQAQSLRNGQTPAEFPPASFNGTQYVDSRGCVFIRAGIDGNVTWVPRVNRQRQLICGQTPSLSANAAAAARSTPTQTTQGTPEQITVAPPARPTATADAAPSAAPVPAPRPTVRTTRPAATTAPTPQPAPRVVVQRPAAPVVRRTAPPPAQPTVVQAAPRTVTAQRAVPACQGASPVSARYINSGQYGPVRCGPQQIARGSAAAVGPETRVVPRHVYENRTLQRAARVPEGYVPVWKDDRLNPRRAEQSLNGIAQTRLVWTQTVPRRLIERSTGRDVTATVPLVYPYTDVATQERNLGTVTLVRRNGQLMKRVQRKSSATARQPVVSTRSAPAPVVKAPARTAPKAAGKAPSATTQGRYVQVGTFGVPANAQAAAQRIARAGLPARIGRVTRGGKSYQVVLAGPFASSTDLSRGLQSSRAAGFSDAFVRK